MPQRFKLGDIVVGNHDALRYQHRRITEVIAIGGGNTLKVRWLNEGEGTYTSRAIQFHVPAQRGGVDIGNNILPRNAVAEEIRGKHSSKVWIVTRRNGLKRFDYPSDEFFHEVSPVHDETLNRPASFA